MVSTSILYYILYIREKCITVPERLKYDLHIAYFVHSTVQKHTKYITHKISQHSQIRS